MGLNATARRRWAGALILGTALAMVAMGLSFLEGRLHGLVFLGYWLACLALTMLAMVIALLDAWAVGRQSRQRQKDLIENTMKDIEVQARAKHDGPSRAEP